MSESVPKRRPRPRPVGPAETAREWHLPDADAEDPAAWEARLRGLARAFAAFVPEAKRVAAAERDAAAAARRDAHERAAAAAAHERRELGGAAGEATDAALSLALRHAARLAPGLASLEHGAPGWTSAELVGAGVPHHQRVGTIDVAGAGGPAGVPVVLPFLGTCGWQLWSDSRAAAHGFVQNAVLRVVAASEAMRVRVDAYDPRISGAFGLFGELQQRHPGIMPPPAHSPDELAAALGDLVTTSTRRGARLTQFGHGGFPELVASTEHGVEPYRIVVLLDYPAGVDAKAQDDLVRIATTADARGICLLVHHDPDVTPEHGVDVADLLTLLHPVALEDGHVVLDDVDVGGAPIRLDPPPPAAQSRSVCTLVADRADAMTLPTVDFAATLPPESEWWQPAGDELTTVIGYADERPAAIRLRSGNPPLPNVLVGGAVGQGKSNLLLNLVHGLAARYAPADLEMYLLDFKQGLEFAALGPAPGREHWLPHARVIGVHSDRPFGLAVLRHIAAELTRRSDMFKARGNVADIAQLPPSPDRPPRILVVLDEFQVLLDEGETGDEAARLLEQLVRLGRAYGVHVVLATQSLSGIQRLATRRDSIFGQVPYRIVLKTTPGDSQQMLQLLNTAAAQLRFRGEAVLNDDYGAVDANQRVLISYADKGVLDDLRRRLWRRSGGAPRGSRERRGALSPPRVFQVGEPARLTDVAGAELVREDAESLGAWVGMPISVGEDPVTLQVRPEPGAGLAVLGDGPADALGVLGGVAYALARGGGPGTRFVLLDCLPPSDELAEGRQALVDLLRRLGRPVEVVARDELGERLDALRGTVRSGGADGPCHVLGYGLHRAGRLAQRDALREVVRDGPLAGVFTYGWWNRLHVLTDQLGPNRGNLSAYLFLQHPADGVRRICGPTVSWASERYRGLYWDGMGDQPEVVVPFGPLRAADVDPLAGSAS
ncbi:MAG TPA: FtsK/SpoIIIE domain-containing protein [Streptosporangiales bacterium]